ncbi:1-acyl-sn-glycerol-3-phosphate acyltransferase [Mangrovicoccus sp. HB161399]|uniref:lysophospholipid acyltransferase family protein n=1 Tax=Mangrovicoccus sp. HB161399 TaxID=2720392 RepID=UPI0015574D54|nr:lysophospholipid acyltransferase family protein [Mangrovicoccus sp. HB161399]
MAGVTWHSDTPPVTARPEGAAGWLRVLLRGGPVILAIATGLLLTALLRLVEAPLCRSSRPVTPWITVGVCRIALRGLGLPLSVEGRPDPQARLLVSNHVSWTDIFVLNALGPLYFVAKSEVSGWPGIGLLARATGTVFISRDPRASAAQAAMLKARLGAGHRLMVFPEGTSTDGRRVVPFRSAMFGALDAAAPELKVQPLTVAYHPPEGADPRFYGWWGDMDMGPHLLQLLSAPRRGRVRVIWHPAVPAAGTGRKELARGTEDAVRAGLAAELGELA